MYVVELARRAWVWGPLLASVLVGCALGPAGIPLIALAIGAVLVASRGTRVRAAIDRSIRHRALLDRRDEREVRLEEASVRCGLLRSMTELVDRIASQDPVLAEQLELEELLDHVADALIARARWVNGLVADPVRSRIHARRRALAAHADARIRSIDDDLAAVFELLSGLVLRTSLDVVGARVMLRDPGSGARSMAIARLD